MTKFATTNPPPAEAPRRVIQLRRARTAPSIPIARASNIQDSLDEILALLLPIVEAAEHDAAMAALVMAEHEFTEPLSRFEMKVLACGLYKKCDTNVETFDYADVLDLTDRFSGHPMNITMVYKTISHLVGRRLLKKVGANSDNSTRTTQKFSITDAGREAFKLSILVAQHLRNQCASEAA